MKRTLFISILMCLGSMRVTFAGENTLRMWAKHYQNVASQDHPQIAVTAYLKRASSKYLLAFKLTNISKKPLTFYPYLLPWGNLHSITLGAITTDGRRLSNLYRISDPVFQPKITLAPGESRQGDYDLAAGLDLTKASKSKDVLVFWTYRTPTDFNHGQTVCTGVAVVPKDR